MTTAKPLNMAEPFNPANFPAPRPLRLPETADRQLPNGLRILVARRNSAPLAELCLSVPMAHANPATSIILAGTIGAAPSIQDRIRSLGGGISAAIEADALRIAGSTLADRLPEFLTLLAELVSAPDYAVEEVSLSKKSSVHNTIAMLASPGHHVSEALNTRMYGDHPYGMSMPRPDALAAVDRDAVCELHAERVRATGASLVLAGDVDLDTVLDQMTDVLSDWQPAQRLVPMRPPPPFVPGPLETVLFPGASQSLLRMTMPVSPTIASDYPALAMAVMVFGGYFSSRMMQSIREEKGLSYSPRCSLLHVDQASLATVSVDVVSANTDAAVEAVFAELAGLVARPITAVELDHARRYALGTMRLRLATLTGLVSVLYELDRQGLPFDWLAGHDERLATVTTDAVSAAAAKYLSADNAISVLLRDS